MGAMFTCSGKLQVLTSLHFQCDRWSQCGQGFLSKGKEQVAWHARMPKIAHLAGTELSKVITKYLKASIEVTSLEGRPA